MLQRDNSFLDFLESYKILQLLLYKNISVQSTFQLPLLEFRSFENFWTKLQEQSYLVGSSAFEYFGTAIL